MANQGDENERFICLIDVYTFATQVLAITKGDLDWNDGPSITVLSTGRIISANEHAKAIGINNTIKQFEAERIAGDNLTIYELPSYGSGKPDQTLLRQAGHEVLEVIKNYTQSWEGPPIIQWVPLDEAYVDFTDHINYLASNDIVLEEEEVPMRNIGIAALAVEIHRRSEVLPWPLHESSPIEQSRFQTLGGNVQKDKMRNALHLINGLIKRIHERTGLHCSGGIGPNKMLAKIACSLRSPGILTGFITRDRILVKDNAELVPIKKLTPLSKLTRLLLEAKLGVTSVWDLQHVPFKRIRRLASKFSLAEDPEFIQQVAFGFNDSVVQQKIYLKNINCARNFHRPILTYGELKFQLEFLIDEFHTRLREHHNWYGRRPQRIHISVQYMPRGRRLGRRMSQTFNVSEEELFGGINALISPINVLYGIKRLRISGLNFYQL